MPTFRMLLVVVFASVVSIRSLAADEQGPKALVEKGIQALGGEEKIAKAAALQWKVEGKLTFGENENPFVGSSTIQALDRLRSEFEGDFGGNKFKGVTVLNGDNGWRKFGDMSLAMDKDAVANEKRMIYLQVVPITLVPLKSKDFQIEAAGEEKVNDKPAAGIKVTGPDGKDFKLYFDKSTNLPVRQVAQVIGFMGDEFTQETTYAKYKEFGGIQKATRIESRRDGQTFIVQDVLEFKTLEKVPSETFDEPK